MLAGADALVESINRERCVVEDVVEPFRLLSEREVVRFGAVPRGEGFGLEALSALMMSPTLKIERTALSGTQRGVFTAIAISWRGLG